MTNKTWTVTGSNEREVHVEIEQGGMTARIRAVPTYAGEGPKFEVDFSSALAGRAGKLYARAEAARFFAQVCDTAGDLEETSDEPLDVRDPKLQLVEGAEVSLNGTDAGTVIAVYFEGATEQLVDLIPGLA